MHWDVRFRQKVVKQIRELPEPVQMAVKFLVKDLQISGPVGPNLAQLRQIAAAERLLPLPFKEGTAHLCSGVAGP